LETEYGNPKSLELIYAEDFGKSEIKFKKSSLSGFDEVFQRPRLAKRFQQLQMCREF
jgi:hypothetical protein